MFSYTDDAIVTSSPTGRHLSTVIRHPAGMPSDQWRKHADQVCTVLNELDSKAKANSLSLHLQTVGRVERIDALREQYVETIKRGFAQTAECPSLAELIDAGYLAPSHRRMRTGAEPRNPVETCVLLEQRIAQLEKCISSLETECSNARDRLSETEKQLDDATTKLCAAQMLLEKPVRLTASDLVRVMRLKTDTAVEVDGRTLARVE